MLSYDVLLVLYMHGRSSMNRSGVHNGGSSRHFILGTLLDG